MVEFNFSKITNLMWTAAISKVNWIIETEKPLKPIKTDKFFLIKMIYESTAWRPVGYSITENQAKS